MNNYNVAANLFLFLAVIFSSVSCSAQEFDDEFLSCRIGENELSGERITSDEIMIALLTGPLAWERIEPFLSDTEIVEIPSIHSPVVNYVVGAKDDESSYAYYFSNGNSFPLCLIIKSGNVLESITSDMLESEYLSEILNKENSELVIDTLEAASVAKLSYRDGMLTSVIFRTTYID
ncbi:MAG: hypothetical protein Q8L60_00625 [Gammaproteobacteria bacterium]|nr:hypothetical protein [Gammaproteobacteria bacterium]MDP2346634.1 hypothetical protein [Gammaproteobacteria bacterium]